MTCIRNKNWSDNDDLKADLTRYIREDLSREEILDLVRWDPRVGSQYLQGRRNGLVFGTAIQLKQ